MGFNLAIIASILMWANVSHAGTRENQRKYHINSELRDDRPDFLTKGLGPYQFSQYRVASVTDLYFDTARQDLLKRGYSFRMRMTAEGDRETYSVQLKREMQALGEAREEYDYSPVSLFRYVESDVRCLFAIATDHTSPHCPKKHAITTKRALAILSQWINEQKQSPNLPFQALRALGFDDLQFEPQIKGESLRHRYMVYIDRLGEKTTLSLAINRKDVFEHHAWNKLRREHKTILFEASYDDSSFTKLKPQDKCQKHYAFAEFEVENKFKPSRQGRVLLDQFHHHVINNTTLAPLIDSKYKRSADMLSRACPGENHS